MLKSHSLRFSCLLALALFVVGEVAAQERLRLDPSMAVTQYTRDTWTAEDGLPQGTINALAQTKDGYLWLGTQEGLVRFDGADLDVFDKYNSNQIKNTVSALLAAQDGSLWIGTRGGGATKLAGSEFQVPEALFYIRDYDVTSLASGTDGSIWIGTSANGLIKYHNGAVKTFDESNGLPSNNVSALMVDRDNQVWIGTSRNGYALYDGTSLNSFGIENGLPSPDIRSLFQSSDGHIWIGTTDGLVKLQDGNIRALKKIAGAEDKDVRAIFEDNSGSIWIGTEGEGLIRFANDTHKTLSTANGFIHDKISQVYQDFEGSLWIGTNGGGLARLRSGKFQTYTTAEGLAHDYALAIHGDVTGALWVGTEGGGVSRLKDGQFTNINTTHGLAHNEVWSIAETRDGSIWMGSGGGLNRFKDGQITTFTSKDGLLEDDTIVLLYTDSKDNLWIGYFGGGLQRYRDGKFEWFAKQQGDDSGLSSTFVTVIMEGVDGDIWVGTYNGGLNRILDGKVVDQYTTENGLLNNYVMALYQDAVGIVWVGTRDGGLHRLDNGKIQSYTTQDGLFNNTIQHIAADGQGNLWMTSNQGLSRVGRQELNDYAAGKINKINAVAYNTSHGLLSNEFNGGFQPAGWKSADGRLWFPSNKGIVSIDPANISTNQVPPKVVVQSVISDDREVQPGESLAPGSKNLEIQYAALTFIAKDRVKYQYKLDGFDDDWQDIGSRKAAFYTNLKPGDYQFHVRAANADGTWCDEEATFSFTMRPFFYQTIWFYLLCALIVALLAFLFYRYRVNRLKVRQRELEGIVEERTRDLREEKEKTETALRATEVARRDAERQKEIALQASSVIEAQAEQLREMDRIKSRFFGNISHEFRTPLTLTIGPLENALTGVYGEVSPQLGQQLDVMLRNSRRLLRLINQLLDLSKLESGNLKLKPRKGDLVNLTEGVVMSFTAFAEKEGIALDFETAEERTDLFYDPEAIEKVLFNLISNAVKFTPSGGNISVGISEAQTVIRGASYETVEICVRDSGAGIPAVDLPNIFDRFHQVDGTVSRVQEGTGIGLSLVKELVDLHGGTIMVESALGEGTEFTVVLPKGSDHFDKSEIHDGESEDGYEISHGPMVEMAVFDDLDQAEQEWEMEAGTPSKTILVVDDSRDIRDYVVSCLRKHYAIITAGDGIEGLEKLKEKTPDLIISDVMMPRMDGYAFCRAIKKDPDLTHIPVILLTSKASLEAKLEGLEAGSDDYLAKPFNAKELRVRIRNLMRLRTQARELQGLNDELVETNGALLEASELKSQLLNIASHDMKNPLTAIREFARIIGDEIGSDSHLNELLELIYSSSNEMLTLVTQLLDSAALESGKLRLNKRPVDVSSLAEIVVHRNRNQAKIKGQEIDLIVCDGEEAFVHADFERLQEAMDNLVSNAIKYSPLDCKIAVRVRPDGSSVIFEVEDEGPGISDDDKEKLFGKFQKLSAQPTGGESSTGLGLSIVKQIVELHGGRVQVNSALGDGSTFGIELAALTTDDVEVSALA